jgi:hypothetical protein
LGGRVWEEKHLVKRGVLTNYASRTKVHLKEVELSRSNMVHIVHILFGIIIGIIIGIVSDPVSGLGICLVIELGIMISWVEEAEKSET